jgi:hypothetical protein
LTVTVERIDGGKLRCTCATWSDPVIILEGEALALVNIERQAHALRTPAPGSVVTRGTANADVICTAPAVSPSPTPTCQARSLGPERIEQNAPEA